MMKGARSITISTMVDNYTTALLSSTENIRRWDSGKNPLLAEHGFALMVEVEDEGGGRRCFMLDAGGTQTSLPYNMDRMEVDPRRVEFLVISHGHWDHTGSVVPLIQRSQKELPVMMHPEAFRERWKVFPDGRRVGPRQVTRRQWEEAGARLVIGRESRELFPGCLCTGEIPRKNDWEKAPASARFRQGEELVPDQIPDDQAVVVHLKDRGLVILAGCAHAGIINTIHHACTITGMDRIWAVMGGFHLTEASEEHLAWTIEEMQAANPRFVVPTHCTGFHAQTAFSLYMPETFVLNAVGTTIHFA